MSVEIIENREKEIISIVFLSADFYKIFYFQKKKNCIKTPFLLLDFLNFCKEETFLKKCKSRKWELISKSSS